MSTIKLTATGGGGGTVSLKAPTATTSNAALELTLPVDDGTSGQYLKTDGNGVLSFDTVSAGVTRTSSSWVATNGSNEYVLDGIPTDATHVRVIGEKMKIVDNANIRWGVGTSSAWLTTSGAYRITETYHGESDGGAGTSAGETHIETNGLADLDYDRTHIIDFYKLNTSNLWAVRMTVHYYNNESSGSSGNKNYFVFGNVQLDGAFYKVRAYNNTFSGGSMKMFTWN